MIFLTRELYQGTQPYSGWDRRAGNEWQRRSALYHRYFKVIQPLLPAAVRRLCKQGLHDAVVLEVAATATEVTLQLDATHALSGFRGRQVCLTLRGVKNRPQRMKKLVGQWWLYEEAHLSSRARFSLQVLFEEDELEIEADELRIYLSKNARPRRDA